jgi:Tol biopolymer transport system component
VVSGLSMVQLPHGPIRQLASILGNPQGLAWAADGSHLIFSKDPGNGGELWRLSLGGEVTQLPFGEEGSAPAVAAKGDRIAYVRGRGTLDIWRADLTTEHPEETATRLIYSTRTQMLARYSPDGTRIAFQSNRSGSAEIWLSGADGADPERITSFNGPYTTAPSWCSDGRRIAFDSRASGASAIYVEDIAARVPRKVVTSEDNLSLPVWSPDCRWLFAIRNNNALYRFRSSGGPAERFSQEPSSSAVVIGDRVVFTVMRADGALLWTKPVTGGPGAPLENMPKLGYPEVWMATAAGIYYTDSAVKPIAVKFYDFAARTKRTVMSLEQTPTPGGAGLDVSPDGHWLLYNQIDNKQSEIVLAPAP